MRELKMIYGSRCTKGVEKYSGFGARALKTRLWIKTCVHCLLHGHGENFG
jgi:hypothetical protein